MTTKTYPISGGRYEMRRGERVLVTPPTAPAGVDRAEPSLFRATVPDYQPEGGDDPTPIEPNTLTDPADDADTKDD